MVNFAIVSKAIKVIFFSSAWLTILLGPNVSLAQSKAQSKTRIEVTKPTPFNASYEVYSGDSKIGEVIFSFKHVDNNNYTSEGSATTSGVLGLVPNVSASVKSSWKYINGHIQPVWYNYKASLAVINKKMFSVYDWSKYVATVNHNGTVRKVTLEDGDLDQSLVPLAVMQDMKRKKLRDEYRYVDRRRIKKYKFKIIGKEQVDTKLGRFDAVLVETIERKKKRHKVKRRTRFWSVPKLDYLPVRVTHKSGDDKEVVMSLTKLSGELGYRLKDKIK
ncbi:MAG: DUF3108 domain-containing protein [Acidiferrobacterales bacterium]